MRCFVLLAQRSRWDSLGTRFSGKHLEWQREDLLGLAAMVACFVGVFWLLRQLAKWQNSRPTDNSPKRLLADLCNAHGLSYRERQACRETAREADLAHPTELFVRPELKETLGRRDPALADRLFARTADHGEKR